MSHSTPRRCVHSRLSTSLGLSLLLAGLAACGDSNLRRESVTGFPVGSVQANPASNALSRQFVVDPNYGGQQTSLKLKEVYWGRLVDIVDSTDTSQAVDAVIGQLIGNGTAYEFSTNPITDKTTVKIRYPAGSAQYAQAYEELLSDANLTRVADVGLNPVVTIPFIPRNAALVLQFDDLLDASKIDGITVRLRTGNPPVTPFLGRVVPDLNHGDLANFDGQPGLEFYTTRVIIDSTVSSFDAQSTGLPVNSLGFPGALSLGQANLQIRIPTRTDAESNQTRVLTNPTNHGLASSGNGTIDTSSTTRDLVRALRTGGTGDATGDPNNGFLPDNDPPSILGRQPVTFGTIDEVFGTDLYRTELTFAFAPCALRLRAGDVIQQAVSNCTVFAVVACPPGQTCGTNQAASGGVSNGVVADVYFRYLRANTPNDPCATRQFDTTQVAQLGISYSPTLHPGAEPCFLSFSSVGAPPNRNVATDSTVSIRFSEPMDPSSVTAFDTFTLTRYDRGYTDVPADPIDTNPQTLPTVAPKYRNFVVGRVSASPDLREFRFLPTLPLNHAVGVSEAVYVTLVAPTAGRPGIRDLAGNGLVQTFATPDTAASPGLVGFELDPAAAQQRTDGFVFRFDRLDMVPGTETAPGAGDPDNDGFGTPEFRGEFLIDPQNQLLRPRPVTRFQAAADRTQAIPSLMVPFAPGVQTPISRYGSKLQTIWRYCDLGFSLLDEQFFNLDVEHLYWAPAGGAVVADTIPRLEISLTTSIRIPDEAVDPNLLPIYPNSGLETIFAQNVLDAANDPLRTVHPGAFGQPGYVIQPIDASITQTGTTVMPWPLNFNITPDRRSYYTFRNTGVLARGGPNGRGVDITLVNPGPPTYGVNQVPTIGLPLLMEFRCYPSEAITGANAFDISIAVANSSRPNFRAFSTGGLSTTGIVVRDPGLQDVAVGGFNPNSTPTPGAGTLPVDNSFYIGAADMVIRVSRAFSTWFDSGSSGVRYSEPVIEPAAGEQPAGTQIQLAFRGANLVPTASHRWNADALDPYGEGTGTQPTFFQSTNTWRSTMAQISSPDGIQSGARFFQLRLTFLSNAATNLAPTLSALGIAWRE
ncbi:MAG: hypothetical protein JNK02_11765 [Planctomycetes bacterium]|nr:hypothetical protein [Planctomycetota bacterium]